MVAHLLSGLAIGGKERAALRLADRARPDGFDPTLILFDTPFRSEALDLHPGDLAVHFLPRAGGLDLRFARRLAMLLRSLNARIVHAHNETALVYAALASRICRPRPGVVATFHTMPSHGGLAARLLARVAGQCATVVAVAEELAGRLGRSGWVRDCRVIWNGVETDRYTPGEHSDCWRERLSVGPGDVLIGHVARFDPVKRHDDLLDAARRLQAGPSRIVLVLLGQGALLPAIREQARGLAGIRFVTQVSDMVPFLRSLDGFVLCSAHEAAPLALLEAMACGVPVVATEVGGVPHLLGADRPDGPAGILVPPRDPGRLATELARLACDAALRKELAAAARERALDFPFEAEWRAYRRLYERDPRDGAAESLTEDRI